jgi:uncharacterized protein YehS (DUF1456 family)
MAANPNTTEGMTNNEVMKSVRYTLQIKNKEVLQRIGSGGVELTILEVVALFKDEAEEGYHGCSAKTLHAFLDGLILQRRGPSSGPAKKFPTSKIDNNTILRKLRIGFEMRDTDIIATLENAGLRISKSEVSALFRAPSHKHFKQCGDQFLRNFLKGLTHRFHPNVA